MHPRLGASGEALLHERWESPERESATEFMLTGALQNTGAT
jgi:hypothetical protein